MAEGLAVLLHNKTLNEQEFSRLVQRNLGRDVTASELIKMAKLLIEFSIVGPTFGFTYEFMLAHIIYQSLED